MKSRARWSIRLPHHFLVIHPIPTPELYLNAPSSCPPFSPAPLCAPTDLTSSCSSRVQRQPTPQLAPTPSRHLLPPALLPLSPAMAASSPFDCVLLDLDDTLYPGDTGLGPALRRNIDEFLQAKLGVSAERAAAMRAELFRTHGSSLAGLIALGYDVHPDEYHSYVHGRLPYDRIPADPQLARTLQSIPQRKVLFTNSDRAHMKRALERLGVDEAVFDDVVCFETMNPHLFGEARDEQRAAAAAGGEPPVVVLKPSVDAIVAGLRVAGTNPRRTLFLDDSERNIAAGKALGLRTALVGKRVRSKEADYALESIGALRRVIPEIWGVAGAGAPEGGIGERSDHGIDKMPMRSDLDSIIQPTSIQA